MSLMFHIKYVYIYIYHHKHNIYSQSVFFKLSPTLRAMRCIMGRVNDECDTVMLFKPDTSRIRSKCLKSFCLQELQE